MPLLTNTHTLCYFLFLLNSFINPSFSQSHSPQNIETFYPNTRPLQAPVPAVPVQPPNPTSTPVVSSPPPPILQPPPRSPSHRAVYTAVGVTAASTLVVAAAVFFLLTMYYTKRKNEDAGVPGTGVGTVSAGGGGDGGGRVQPLAAAGEFTRFDGNLKGLIVDEDGLDVLYWRKLEGSSSQRNKSGPFHKDVFRKNGSHGKTRAFSRGKSSSSSSHQNHDDQTTRLLDLKPLTLNQTEDFQATVMIKKASAAPPPPPPPPPPTVVGKRGPVPPPPPPPVGAKKGLVPLTAPPVGGRKGLVGPPPPPPVKGGGSSRPPPAPKRTPSGSNEEDDDEVKMRALHWEKVNVNTDHSMVWDKVERGSFQYNGDMMEALFGYVAANRKSPKPEPSRHETKPTSTASPPKTSILDSRRSQNIAIVIRALGITRTELIEGLRQGRGLTLDVLEKLTRIAPTREEKTLILGFNGDPTKLPDAESFLYHLLKSIPSSFTRINTMMFRYTYGSEISQLKESLQVLDSACTELRNRGVFLKLLEAILKAGNRLNVGTTRGDAKAFNLTALRKLSDYKSSDGKTTLLHFVVHEVVRNEGRRCVMNRNNNSGSITDIYKYRGDNNNLSRSNSQRNSNSNSNSSSNSKTEEIKSKEEQEKEFLQLGLPIVGGLSAEFSNTKKAATFDYNTIISITTLTCSRVSETRELVLKCGVDEKGREFVKEMQEFLTAVEEEIKVVQEEQTRVMEYVKKTTQYYQAGGFTEKQPLELFVIVKDFLDAVDKACIDITRSLQQKKVSPSSVSSESSSSSSVTTPHVLRTRVTFPRLPKNFLLENPSGSESNDER